MKYKFYYSIILVLLLGKQSLAQNYFYTYLKVPLFDYLSKSNEQRPDKDSDGIAFNAGYAIDVLPDVYLETGIDYLIGNTLNQKSYTNNTLTELKSETSLRSEAFSFQIRPTYMKSIDMDDQTYLILACGVSYRKLFTDATFTTYSKNNNVFVSGQVKQDNVKSNFHLALEPKLAVEFKTEKKIAYRFGFNYVNINWDRSIRNVEINDLAYQQPKHRTSSVLFFAGFVF